MSTSNRFGNGVFDGYGIVVGHEYAEAVTDPDNFFSFQDGWNDATTSENGDNCAWYHTQNITLGAHQFAIQPMPFPFLRRTSRVARALSSCRRGKTTGEPRRGP